MLICLIKCHAVPFLFPSTPFFLIVNFMSASCNESSQIFPSLQRVVMQGEGQQVLGPQPRAPPAGATPGPPPTHAHGCPSPLRQWDHGVPIPHPRQPHLPRPCACPLPSMASVCFFAFLPSLDSLLSPLRFSLNITSPPGLP